MILHLGRNHVIVSSTIACLTKIDLISAPSKVTTFTICFGATVPLVTCCTNTNKTKLIAWWHKLRSLLPLFEKMGQSIDFWQ